MATIRVARRDRFTMVDRRTVNDERLSYRARGILFWLLDKPDGYRVDSDQIASKGTEGRDAVRTAMKELRTLGYLVTERRQVDGGKWTTESVIYERPHTEDGNPGVGATSGNDANAQVTPTTGNPEVGAPGGTNETGNERAPAAQKRRRSDPRSDALTREWWERLDHAPMGKHAFVAARGIVSEALGQGWGEEEVRLALHDVDPPMVTWKLEAALRSRQPAAAANPAAARFWEQ